MSLEYLGTSKAPVRRRALWIVLALVVALAAAGVWWTEHLRQDADLALASAAQEARDRTASGEAKVLSTLTYASPMIWSTSVPEDVRAGLRRLVEKEAAGVSSGLARLHEDVAGTIVLPWQGPQEKERDQVLALIEAERHRFDRIAADARDIGAVLAEPQPA